ncbi:Acyl carrier protein [Pseudomonas fluorescens]|uniref:phosphopantetheine-binding protein n=1 Tax=Pseudomonas fluorescens TaxID=294 RepID=UPI00123F1BEA|nr:phosphopantetheine-binding protein [Pseudomonas fluorescens]VVP32605.1 Acyl carrier protein [Pseudomonas fluorescens]
MAIRQPGAPSEAINSAVYSVLSRHLLVSLEHIQPHSRLVDDLYADSMDLLDMFMQISEVLDVDLNTDKLAQVRYVSELCEVAQEAVEQHR